MILHCVLVCYLNKYSSTLYRDKLIWYTHGINYFSVLHSNECWNLWSTDDAHACGDSSDLDKWRILSWKANPPLSAGHWPPDAAVSRSSGQLLNCWWQRCCWTWLTLTEKVSWVLPAPERHGWRKTTSCESLKNKSHFHSLWKGGGGRRTSKTFVS